MEESDFLDLITKAQSLDPELRANVVRFSWHMAAAYIRIVMQAAKHDPDTPNRIEAQEALAVLKSSIEEAI